MLNQSAHPLARIQSLSQVATPTPSHITQFQIELSPSLFKAQQESTVFRIMINTLSLLYLKLGNSKRWRECTQYLMLKENLFSNLLQLVTLICPAQLTPDLIITTTPFLLHCHYLCLSLQSCLIPRLYPSQTTLILSQPQLSLTHSSVSRANIDSDSQKSDSKFWMDHSLSEEDALLIVYPAHIKIKISSLVTPFPQMEDAINKTINSS